MLVVLWQINFYLVAGGLGLLQANDVRIVGLQKAVELALVDDGADAIDVPGKESHTFLGLSLADGVSV